MKIVEIVSLEAVYISDLGSNKNKIKEKDSFRNHTK